MATFNVALLIISVGSIASSVVADDQQNQNKTAQNGGGDLKHLFRSDVFTELRNKQNAMAEKVSGIETKLEKQVENGGGTLALMTMLTSNRLEKEIEDGMRENRNVMTEKMSGIEAKLEKQIENGMRDSQNLLSTKLENGMRENQNALAEKVLGTEAKLENQIENVFTKLRDNQNASVTKLENRIENGMRENQNALVEQMSGIAAKLENQIENEMRDSRNLLSTKLENGMRENQNAMAEKMSGIEAKLEKQIENGMRDTQNLLSTKLENGMRENQNAMAEKVSGIKAKLENQIENVFTELRDNQNRLTIKLENGMRDNQKALTLIKNMLFHSHSLPIYRWNASDCDFLIVINESTNAILYNLTEGFIKIRSCRAGPIKMPSAADRIGIIYTEYRILSKNKLQLGGVSIGLSAKEMPLDTSLGSRVSYGYAEFGRIESTNANGNETTIWANVPTFRIGDVAGCGLNRATRQVFFTKNGQRLNITNLYVEEYTADFYPTVSLFGHGDAVEANFGPIFKYDLSKEF